MKRAPAAPISRRVRGIAAMSAYVWSSVMSTTTLGRSATAGLASASIVSRRASSGITLVRAADGREDAARPATAA